jgi:hypothetical protein
MKALRFRQLVILTLGVVLLGLPGTTAHAAVSPTSVAGALVVNGRDPQLSPSGATSWTGSDAGSMTTQIGPGQFVTSSGTGTISFDEGFNGSDLRSIAYNAHLTGDADAGTGMLSNANLGAKFTVSGKSVPYRLTGSLDFPTGGSNVGGAIVGVLQQRTPTTLTTIQSWQVTHGQSQQLDFQGTLVPGDYEFFLTMTLSTGNNQHAEYTITNLLLTLDAAGSSLSIGDITAPEGNSGTTTFSFPVTLSSPASSIVTVDYETHDGTATASSDFTFASGTLTFNPGDQTKQIAVQVIGDTVTEPDETFTVVLSNPTNATIAKSTGIGTILNDDVATVAVTSIEANQGVDAPDINGDGIPDLVAERPMVIRVSVSVSGLQFSQPVEAQVTFQGTTLPIQSKTAAVLGAGLPIDFFVTPSTTTGQTTIVATVDPNDKLKATGSGSTKKLTVEAKTARAFYVAYLRVDCLGALNSYATTVSQAGEFLAALYPVAPSKLTNKEFDVSVVCTGDANSEATNLWLEGKLLSLGQADRIVGITDPTWMASRRPGALGFAWCGGPQAFAVDGRWTAVSHEIGHTLQLSHPAGTPALGAAPCALPAGALSGDGYWVAHQQPMGAAPSLMGTAAVTPPSFPAPDGWVTRDDYAHVFSDYFRTNPTDPEVLLVNGTLRTNGTVGWGSLYRLPDGVVDTAHPGPYAIRVLDAGGGVLYERTFDARFFVMTHPATPVDVVPFAYAVPYGPNAASVAVLYNGQVLAKTTIASTLLRAAIQALPDAAFTKDPSQRRNALLNKVDALDGQLAGGDTTGARNKLQNDIRKQLDDWLADGFQPQTPLQYSKAQVLQLVDELIQRLGS